MVSNDFFLQFLSDILDTKIIRSEIQETTALGAAFIAGYQIEVYKSLNSISKKLMISTRFSRKIDKSYRFKLLKGWQQAIKKTLV